MPNITNLATAPNREAERMRGLAAAPARHTHVSISILNNLLY